MSIVAKMTGEVAVAEGEMPASADEVASYRLDFLRLSEYNPDVSEIIREADGEEVLGAGAIYRFTLTTAAGPHVVVLTVAEFEPGRLVRAKMTGTVEAEERFDVEPIDDRTCRARLSLSVEIPEAMAAFAQDMRRNGLLQIEAELVAMARVFAEPDGVAP